LGRASPRELFARYFRCNPVLQDKLQKNDLQKNDFAGGEIELEVYYCQKFVTLAEFINLN